MLEAINDQISDRLSILNSMMTGLSGIVRLHARDHHDQVRHRRHRDVRTCCGYFALGSRLGGVTRIYLTRM